MKSLGLFRYRNSVAATVDCCRTKTKQGIGIGGKHDQAARTICTENEGDNSVTLEGGELGRSNDRTVAAAHKTQESNDALQGELDRCNDRTVASSQADTKTESVYEGDVSQAHPVALATRAPLTHICRIKRKSKQENRRELVTTREEERKLRAVMGISAAGLPYLGSMKPADVNEVQSRGSELTSRFFLARSHGICRWGSMPEKGYWHWWRSMLGLMRSRP